MVQNKTAIYLRLSKEDHDKVNKGDDSASIKNQRLLLTDFAIAHHFEVIEVYSDDDESGLYDDRPAFTKLLEDAKLGRFNIVLAKSQSRFTRNMEHLEKYLHHDFVLLGIRFIGVIDHVDTADDTNKKSRQINGLVNEWYCEDLSKNIRETFAVKMKDGQYLGSSTPYGYVKDPKDHNHLVIDSFAAEIVRKIFGLYLQGNGKSKIASILSKEGVLIPSLYKQQVLGQNYYNAHLLASTKYWSYQTIHMILNNEVYIGNLVQNKYQTVSYKDTRKKAVNRSDWIKVEHTHEPIIDTATFELVKEKQKVRTRSVSHMPNGLFSGMLFCADCKHAMARDYQRHKDHAFKGYVCSTYKRCGKTFCKSHAIGVEELETMVLQSIKLEAKKILTAKDICELEEFRVTEQKELKTETIIKSLKDELVKIEKYKRKAYESFVDELLSKEEYLKYMGEYQEKEDNLKNHIEIVHEEFKSGIRDNNQYENWVVAFKDYMNVNQLTKEMVAGLIDNIEINQDKTILIRYKFNNPYYTNLIVDN